MNVTIPSGQGDWLWMWQKLCHVKSEISRIEVSDGFPQRTLPLIELCGFSVSYSDLQYEMMCRLADANGIGKGERNWLDLKSEFPGGMILEANRWLDEGKHISDWLPDLPITYRPPIRVPKYARDFAAENLPRLFDDNGGPTVGISCASYRGSDAWRTWGRPEWIWFLKSLRGLGYQPVLLGGFWDDLTSGVSRETKCPDLVGRTDVAECVAVLDSLDYYIGFASGLMVIRSCLGKPAFSLWPKHLASTMEGWCSPDDRASGLVEMSYWKDPEEILREVVPWTERIELPAVKSA